MRRRLLDITTTNITTTNINTTNINTNISISISILRPLVHVRGSTQLGFWISLLVVVYSGTWTDTRSQVKV